VLHAACGKSGRKISPKTRHLGTITQLYRSVIFATKARIDSRKNLLNTSISPTHPDNMVNFSPLEAEIGSLVWGTPANFNGFCVLTTLLHGILVVGVSQTLQHSTEGATYIRQGNRHVWRWPTF